MPSQIYEKTLPILDIWIGDEKVSPEWIDDWERRSAFRALKKLGVRSKNIDLRLLRSQVEERKRILGNNRIRQLLKRELEFSEAIAKAATRLSLGQRQFCVTEIYCPVGSAEYFSHWFEAVEKLNRQDVMIFALPEHWVIETHHQGDEDVQEVIETTGGAPAPSRFFVNYNDQMGLKSRRDTSYPIQIAGAARTADGTIIGGVRHQFRNEGTGFRAKLTVEFPLLSLPSMISGHRWHLACEFSNWIKKAVIELDDSSPPKLT